MSRSPHTRHQNFSTRSGMLRKAPAVLLPVLMLAPLACGSDEPSSAEGAPGSIDVLASFYPLQYVVERVGGDRVSVSNMTPRGSEPHDLELTAQDTAALTDADLVVYLSRFSPAVDEGVDEAAQDRALDVADAADLDLVYTPIEEGQQHSDEQDSRDPHFWLDPTRLELVVTAVAERLSALAPDDAATFTANAADLVADLDALDAEYEAGLATCANTVIVTSHNAFGYLAQRYGLTQVGITGLTPEDEPSPADLAAVTDFVVENDVTTIYYETLVSPDIAETIADETGAKVAVLDPIEGLSDASPSDASQSDYFAVMRANLATLRAAQQCQ